ncbi:tyrosine-type recombinase/integrase [Micromonospora yangpuensis]|uniref:Integrase/recombinase XerD n=1 Tax=Micromonospora yangpuensis TaxID=683228 RepID=A0A1C6VEC6_9ACTN|nr:tyrosine-type recombinase/integrase [Micromonospora yangpuensis]GGM14513.1 tyrosine recombinase XerC [Micromonospora yangpuensis]SCL64688.1 integrase/recombinase XerD [Micromonospora yangpuensis]
MTDRHPKVRRPDPGGYQTWITSWKLSMQAGGRSPRTVELNLDVARFFGGWLRHRHPELGDWDEVGRDHIRGFFAWLREAGQPCPHALRDPESAPASCKGYGKGYANNVGRSLQQFFAWYADEEDAPNPMAKVSVPAAPRPDENPPDVLTSEQLQALVRDAERGRDFESRRDVAILRLFAASGTRLAELALLQVEDIDPHGRQAVVTGKGNLQRTVPFDQAAALALDRYLRVRSKHPAAHLPHLWLGVRRRTAMTPTGVYQMLVRRGRRLGIRIYPHMLRHTFAHRYLDAGGAEGDLMVIAGWRSSQMLRHYGRSAAASRARRAYDRVNVMDGI